MKPAERVALLTALVEGAKAALDAAKIEALTVADVVGVKSFNTPYGAVTIGQKQAAPAVKSPTELLEYVKHTFPTEVEVTTRVRPAFVSALLDRVEWDAETQQFIDPTTGEAIPGLDWSAAGDPYVTWPAGDAQRATKEEAREWFRQQTDSLLGGVAALSAAREGARS